MGRHRNTVCPDCFISMRSDNLKRHQSTCSKVRRVFTNTTTCRSCCKEITNSNFARHATTCRAQKHRPNTAQLCFSHLLKSCSKRIHMQLQNFLQHLASVASSAEYRSSTHQMHFIQAVAKICSDSNTSHCLYVFESERFHFHHVRAAEALMYLSISDSVDCYSLLGLPTTFRWKIVYISGLLHTQTTLEILHFDKVSPNTRYVLLLNLKCSNCRPTQKAQCSHCYHDRLKDLFQGVLRTTTEEISDFYFPQPLYLFAMVENRSSVKASEIVCALVRENGTQMPLAL